MHDTSAFALRPQTPGGCVAVIAAHRSFCAVTASIYPVNHYAEVPEAPRLTSTISIASNPS